MTSNGFRSGIAGLAAVVAGVLVSGCGPGTESQEIATVTSTVTASSEPPSTSAGSHSPERGLADSFGRLSSSLPQPVGVVIAPVGGGGAVSFGDQSAQVAWSTIKIPLAIAAERRNGRTPAETNAIINSDNASAETLWSSLGSPQDAARAVAAVLREGGDETTQVPSRKRRAEYSVFGQTRWPLVQAATFTSNLPCLRGSEYVVSLMGRVAGNQQWGIDTIEQRPTAVKGGWGPSVAGGYIVRQIGLVTLRDGQQAAVAMSTYSPAASMDSGTAALTSVGDWVGRNLAKLPTGRCR